MEMKEENDFAGETYSEVCEFLDLIGDKYVSKIPKRLLNLFKENISEKYKKHINPNNPINQQISNDTLTIIAILNLKYWCKDKGEVERLKKVYNNNEVKYQNMLSKKVNFNDIFKNKIQNENKIESQEIIKYNKIPFYRKLVYIIKSKIIRYFKK